MFLGWRDQDRDTAKFILEDFTQLTLILFYNFEVIMINGYLPTIASSVNVSLWKRRDLKKKKKKKK